MLGRTWLTDIWLTFPWLDMGASLYIVQGMVRLANVSAIIAWAKRPRGMETVSGMHPCLPSPCPQPGSSDVSSVHHYGSVCSCIAGMICKQMHA